MRRSSLAQGGRVVTSRTGSTESLLPADRVYARIDRLAAVFVVAVLEDEEMGLSWMQKVGLVEHVLREFPGEEQHLGVLARTIPTPRRGVPFKVRERILERDGHRCLRCGMTICTLST